LEEKIHSQTQTCRLVLQVAALCLGHKFYGPLLREVMVHACGLSEALFNAAMEEAEAAFLIEPCGEKQNVAMFFKFSHDKIQQTVATTVPVGDARRWLHLSAGRIMLASVDTFEEEGSELKSTVKLLSAQNMTAATALIESMDEKAKLVSLNLEVAKYLRSKCAFTPAVRLLRAASTLLSPREMWTIDRHEEAIDLFTTLAETETSVCERDRCRIAVRTVMARAKGRKDKLRVYLADVDNFIAEDRYHDAMRTAASYIRELGVGYPTRVSKLTLLSEICRTEFAMRGKSDDILRSLPRTMEDRLMKTVMVLLNSIVVCGFWVGDYDAIFVGGLRMLRNAVKHGLSPEGLFGFGMFALVECVFEKYESAKRYAKLAISLWDEIQCESGSLACKFWIQILPFTTLWRPFPECLTDLKMAYDYGMEDGDYHNAFTCVFSSTCCSMYSKTKTLSQLVEDIEQAYEEFEPHGVNRQIALICPIWQSLLNLMGSEQAHPAGLEDGDAMEKFRALIPADEEELDQWVCGLKCHLCYFFDHWSFIEDNFDECENFTFTKLCVSPVLSPHGLMMLALSALRMYSRTGQRRYAQCAKRAEKRLSKLDGCGCPNAACPLLIVRTEFARVVKTNKSTTHMLEQQFLEALRMAKESSWFEHYIILEKLVTMFEQDGVRLRRYLDDLFDVCEDWEAHGLVIHLERKYFDVVSHKSNNAPRIPRLLSHQEIVLPCVCSS